ncbi:UDP-N-acetylglucosamine 2-epimerase [Limisphaera ngatamarikiensis]
MHRAQNMDEPRTLSGILEGLRRVSGWLPVVLPLHPRAINVVERNGLQTDGLRLLDPLSYLDHACLEEACGLILSDSGAVQKEAWWLGVPSVTLREEIEWVDTIQAGANRLAGADPDRIVEAVGHCLTPAAAAPLALQPCRLHQDHEPTTGPRGFGNRLKRRLFWSGLSHRVPCSSIHHAAPRRGRPMHVADKEQT